jgi:hypothetical protein
MSRRVVLAIGLLLLAAPASAFDGHRKGFILGVGAGDSWTSFKQVASGDGTGEIGPATYNSVGSDLELGWGLSDRMLIYYSNHMTWPRLTDIEGNDGITVNAVSTAALSYFLSPAAPSLVVEGGLGLSWYSPTSSFSTDSRGFGAWGGGGYEFSRHWLLRGKVAYGNPSATKDGVKIQTTATSFTISINYLAY